MIKKQSTSCLLYKQQNISEFTQIQCENGIQMELLNHTELMVLLEVIEDTTLLHSLEKLKEFLMTTNCKHLLSLSHNNLRTINEEQFIAELVLPTKNQISKDKLNVYIKYILIMKYLKMLQAESTSNVKDFSNLSKDLLKAISMKLWSPIKTDSRDSHLILSNGCCNNIMSNSWFLMNQIINHQNKNLPKIYYQLYIFSLVDKMENENIKIHQTHQQIQPLRKIPKKNEKKQKIKCDVNKKSCKFIVTKKINKIVYGRTCNNLCNENNDLCDIHINCEIKKYDEMAEKNICKHIITQESRNLNRKGMICGQFTFDSKNQNYCKKHILSHNENMNVENSCLRTFKVRFYPTFRQIEKLNTYFGCARFTYNACIERKETGNFQTLRNKYVTNKEKNDISKDSNDSFLKKFHFLKETPKEIRAYAVKEYATNKTNAEKQYKKKLNSEEWKRVNIKNYKQKNIKNPELTFKRKKDEQSITINKNSVCIKERKIVIYPTLFGKTPLDLIKRSNRDKRLNNILDNVLYHDIKIIRTNTNKYYICMTDDIIKKDFKSDLTKDIKICAIDPGVRTFATVYSENEILELGSNMNDKLGILINERKNKFNEYKISIKHKKTNLNNYTNARQEYRLINEKIKNKINDFHYKMITKLMDYSIIFIPKLNVNRLLIGDLTVKTKQMLKIESHSLMLKRLKDKSEEKGTKIEVITEFMTTKTCSNCFEINDPKKEKIYNCIYCGFVQDRDINASKNIYLQQISKLLK